MKPLPLAHIARAIAISACATITMTAPAVGAPGGCQGAPGASALEQYYEAIPRADGERDRPSGNGQSTQSGSSTPLPSATAAALGSAGRDGEAVSRLAGAAPTATKKSRPARKAASDTPSTTTPRGDAAAASTPPVAAPDEPSSSPVRAVTEAASTGPTANSAVIWGLLGTSALGAVGAVLLRRRHNITPPGDSD